MKIRLALIGVAVVAVMASTMGCGCEKKVDPSPTPSPSASVAVTPTPTATVPIVASEDLTAEEIAAVKADAALFYERAYAQDFDGLATMMSPSMAETFNNLRTTGSDQVVDNGCDILLILPHYSDMSAPEEIGEPVNYGEDGYQVLLRLKEDAGAKINFIKNEDGSFSVDSYSMQSISMGEGGVMGSGNE